MAVRMDYGRDGVGSRRMSDGYDEYLNPEPPPQQYGPPPRGSVPYSTQPFYDGTDFVQQSNNNRARATGQGDQFNQELVNYGQDQDWWNQYYRGQGDSAYGEIAAGRGGYGQQQQEDILGRRGLDDMQMTPEERESRFLSGAERDQIYGDPNKGLAWFDPAWLDSINTEGNKRIHENVDESGRALNNTYNEDALSLSTGYRDELGNIVGNQASGVRGALDGGAGRVRGAIDYGKLSLDPEFRRKYEMTDRDVNDFTQAAALTQGNVSRGRIDAIERAAAGSGGMSPLALAGAYNELTTRGDQQANRAMLDARIAAKGMQADRLKTAEGMRLGAEDNYAGMLSGAEMGLSGREADAEMGLGDRAYGAATDYEQARVGTERDKQTRRYQIADNNADRSYNAINRVNDNTRDAARYSGETGAALYNAADAEASRRAAALAGNRQQTETGAQSDQYDRRRFANEATSNRTRTVADQKLAQEKEYRDWLAGQQKLANDNVQNTFGNRLRNYGQTQQAAQAGTNAAAQYQLGKDSNGFGANFKRALGSGLGSFIGNPSNAFKSSKSAFGY
ncbi:MAG: hypothetical protein EBR82_07225 [Caulobacteraceae bacterium]|nr:hypothetical protein [Caulobacteraceae bacterium]